MDIKLFSLSIIAKLLASVFTYLRKRHIVLQTRNNWYNQTVLIKLSCAAYASFCLQMTASIIARRHA